MKTEKELRGKREGDRRKGKREEKGNEGREGKSKKRRKKEEEKTGCNLSIMPG